jgi:hypothetical protein
MSLVDDLKQRRANMKKESELAKENGFSSDRTFITLPLYGLSINEPVAFRPYGKPIELRTEPTDSLLILQSKIVKNGGKGYTNINWPYEVVGGKYQIDKDWILFKLFKEVTKYDYEKHETPKMVNGKKEYGIKHYHNDGREILTRLITNKRIGESSKFDNQFLPSGKAIMQGIIRGVTTDKLQILVSGIGEKVNQQTGETMYFPKTGIPASTDPFKYESLYDQIANYYIDIEKTFMQYDIIIKKVTNKDYEILEPEGRRTPQDLKDLCNFNDEEDWDKYEKINLEDFYKVSSYQKLLANLGEWIFKQCDKDMGSHYHEELLDLVADEKKMYEANKKKKEENKQDEKPKPKQEQDTKKREVKEEQKIDIKQEEEKPKLKRAKLESKDKPKSIEDQAREAFDFLEKVPEKELSKMLECIEDFDGNVPIYKDSIPLVPCDDDKCKFKGTDKFTELPNFVNICPSCGLEFDTSGE